MKDRFLHHQEETTLRSLEIENRRLKSEILKFKENAQRNRANLDFHDKLEQDFFSADSLQSLIIKLINCLQIRPDIAFVSLCLNQEYLATLLGFQAYGQMLPGLGASQKLGYLSIIQDDLLSRYFGNKRKTIFERTPQGSSPLFFPNHDEEVRSHAIVPLTLRKRLIGTLNIGSIINRHFYTTEEGREMIDRLSSKLAIAIDSLLSNSKLALQKEIIDHDIDRAAILQKSLLPPSMDQAEKLRIWSLYKPCSRLGGDFFDLIPLSSTKSAIIIADVSGHGISAALISAMLKTSLVMEQLKHLKPIEVVSDINRKFCSILKHGDYITLCYCVFDSDNKNLDLVRAGHPYPLLYKQETEDVTEIKSRGTAVGIDKDAVFENIRICINEKDILFLYTDGLTDAVLQKSRPDEFIDMILGFKEKIEPSELPGALIAKLEKMIGEKTLEDDTSLLIASLNL